LCELAVYFRRPLHEVALWPAAELELIRTYMVKRPPVEYRVEAAIAIGQAMYANRGKAKGDTLAKPSDFLTYPENWDDTPADTTDYAKANRETLRAFASLRPRKAPK